MADDKRIELRKALREAIKYRRMIKSLMGFREEEMGLGLSNALDPERTPTPLEPPMGLEKHALLEDAEEGARVAGRALATELRRLGYPTMERKHRDGDPSGLDALHAHIQSEADSKRRRIRFTANKDDVKIFEPKGK